VCCAAGHATVLRDRFETLSRLLAAQNSAPRVYRGRTNGFESTLPDVGRVRNRRSDHARTPRLPLFPASWSTKARIDPRSAFEISEFKFARVSNRRCLCRSQRLCGGERLTPLVSGRGLWPLQGGITVEDQGLCSIRLYREWHAVTRSRCPQPLFQRQPDQTSPAARRCDFP